MKRTTKKRKTRTKPKRTKRKKKTSSKKRKKRTRNSLAGTPEREIPFPQGRRELRRAMVACRLDCDRWVVAVFRCTAWRAGSSPTARHAVVFAYRFHFKTEARTVGRAALRRLPGSRDGFHPGRLRAAWSGAAYSPDYWK